LREYGVGAQILKDLGVRRMVLMSNTRPNVLPGLDGYGLTVEGWRRIDGD
jgi:3,4-dihydroxy 2-butanone 4-phosphate synthase/GTP cyclohydrolase II